MATALSEVPKAGLVDVLVTLKLVLEDDVPSPEDIKNMSTI